MGDSCHPVQSALGTQLWICDNIESVGAKNMSNSPDQGPGLTNGPTGLRERNRHPRGCPRPDTHSAASPCSASAAFPTGAAPDVAGVLEGWVVLGHRGLSSRLGLGPGPKSEPQAKGRTPSVAQPLLPSILLLRYLQ